MHLLFNVIYGILFFSCVAVGGFIVYHFLRYSPSKTSSFIGSVVFLAVFVTLLFTNAMLYFMLPLDTFFLFNLDFGTFNVNPFETLR